VPEERILDSAAQIASVSAGFPLLSPRGPPYATGRTRLPHGPWPLQGECDAISDSIAQHGPTTQEPAGSLSTEFKKIRIHYSLDSTAAL